MKELKNLTYEELITRVTGEAITKLGEGQKFRDIMSLVVHIVTMWREAKSKST